MCLREVKLNTVYDCINSFIPLLSTEYHFILGRKGIAVSLRISFHKKDCFHLMGLQYLMDIPELKRDRGRVFDEIGTQKISKERLESSFFYHKIEQRIDKLPLLETIFDSNETIFKYNANQNIHSKIQADYLMKNNLSGENIYVFLSSDKSGKYFCRSFFPEGIRDYTKNQASWTLLYKEKINTAINRGTVLYDRMGNKFSPTEKANPTLHC